MSEYATLPVPERIHRLKEELFSTSNSICFQRARIVTESYRETEGQHSALRRARALYDVFAKMPVFIREGELLEGRAFLEAVIITAEDIILIRAISSSLRPAPALRTE